MLLTPEEYLRGVVWWTPNSIRSVRTASRSSIDEELSFSEPLADSRGSISTSLPAPRRELEFDVCPPMDPSMPCRITWDRLFKDDIDTMFFDATDGEIRLFDGVVGMGTFRRIVVTVPFLKWNEDLIVRVKDLIIRFHHDDGKGGSNTQQPQVAHPYIEIIVPEPVNLSYEPAFSVLGLIALHFGDAAISTVVTNETREFNSEVGATERAVIVQGLGSTLPTSVSQTFRLPITVPRERFEKLDRDLQTITQDAQPATSLKLGLRWYEQSLRSFSETDRLLSSVVGIEAVVARVSAEEGFRSPIADIVRDVRIPTFLQPLRSQYGADKVDRLLARLTTVNPNVRDRFARFCSVVGWSDSYEAKFRSVTDARNSLVHGSTTTISRSDALEASHLLADVLGAALAWQRRRSEPAGMGTT